MKTGQESVFWTHSGPNLDQNATKSILFYFHTEIETLLFVVWTNEDRDNSPSTDSAFSSK